MQKKKKKTFSECVSKHDLLAKHQSGFREGHSCQTALIRLTDEWLKAIDSGKNIGSVFVDLKKVFDLVDHEILLHKLKLHNFSTKSLALFKSYLTDRKQCISHNNTFSSSRILSSGVPQGSILGPLLFLIYINDMCLHIDASSLDLYANDSTLYKSGFGITEIHKIVNLQNSLETILAWCTVNNMLVNPNKTKCMLIGPKHKLNSINLELKINDVCIELVESHKIFSPVKIELKVKQIPTETILRFS